MVEDCTRKVIFDAIGLVFLYWYQYRFIVATMVIGFVVVNGDGMQVLV
jgi:hypothetical protein